MPRDQRSLMIICCLKASLIIRLTLLDTLLRLFCFSEGFILVADVDVGVEVAARGDVLVGLLDELRAGEDIRLHETRRLLNGLSSKDSFVHSCCAW